MKVNPWVSHDRLDDEVMIIDLDSGAYFALNGAAADAWTFVAGGADLAATTDLLAKRYGVDRARVEADVRHFVDTLVRDRLLTDSGLTLVDDPHAIPNIDAPAGGYVAPSIDKYDDMKDLLLLDPIHEVAEAGWPEGRPA
jgi:hypothetical protein